MPFFDQQRTLFGFTNDDASKKSEKLKRKWRKKDAVGAGERLAYHGPWADSVRWLLGCFQVATKNTCN
jgi:hypothetical protein